MEHGPAQIDDTENLLSSKKPEYYTMPCLRFTNIVKAFLFLDAVVTCVLWLTGGNTTYFVENIFDFHILESVFDLVLITSVKMLFLCIFYSFLESSSYHLIDKPFDAKLLQRKRRLHALVIIISLICFAYSSVKSGLVLYVIIHRPGYRKMHMTYNVLLISSVTFGLLDMVMSMLSFRAMRRLALTRMLHRFNDKGQEVNADGEPLGKKVNLKRLVSLAKPETGLLSVAFLALLASSITQMVAPLFFGKVVDAALVSMAKLNQTVTILFCIYVGGAIASFFRAWLVTLAGQRLVARLRKDLFSRILKQEISFFDSTRTGELMNRLSSDTQVIQNAVTVNVSMLFRYCLQIIGSLGVMFALNAALTGVLLAVVPVVSFGAVQYGRLVKHLQKNFQDRLADAATRAEESFSNVRTVRAFVAERNMSDDYSKEIGESYEMGKKLAFFQGLFEGVIGVFACGAIVLVLWYGGKLVYQNEVSAGLLTSFLLYTLQVAMAFAFLSSLYGDFMQAVGASVRIFDLLDRDPEISLNTGICPSTIDGSVKFGNVRFAYPSRPESEVMQGVSFSVEPGQVVALVGPSGGGKSTVVSLIERFYDPLSGSVFLGGFDLKTLNSNCYHSKISVVNQEPTLFATSIKNNIAFGRDASIEEIVEAAKQANAHDFIMSFQEGYETLVGERGVQLSGGQKQRVAVARALIMNPSLLLLDEATSALDAESEHLVQEAIDRAMVGRTVLIVAHRLSTVRNASQVIVIDRGTIVEQGTHEALLAENGVYKRLVLRQLDVGSHHVPDNDLKQTGF